MTERNYRRFSRLACLVFANTWFFVGACGQVTPPQSTPATTASSPVSAPAASSTPTERPTPTIKSAPIASASASAPALSADEDTLPIVDCKKISTGKEPSRRSLCELAMAKNPKQVIDDKGFAFVTQYETPDDTADPAEGKMKKRVCGQEAEKRVKDVYELIRVKLSAEDASTPSVTCQGTICTIRGEGEWSRTVTLYFRKNKDQTVLEAVTEIEVALVPPPIVAQRMTFLNKWRTALANSPCAP